MNKETILTEIRKHYVEIERIRTANKDLPAADWKQLDELENRLSEVEKLKKSLDTLEKADALEKWSREATDSVPNPATQPPANPADVKMQAFRAYLKGQQLDAAQMKALQADNPTEGGFLVAPPMFVNDLIANIKDLLWIRQLATVQTIAMAESLGCPTLDTDLGDADWNNEIGSYSEDTALRFGMRELKPNPCTKLIKMSKTLIRKGVQDPEAIVRDRLAYRFALTEEKAFLTGSGANQPLGVFTASSQGISTSRDVTAANSTSVVANDFMDMKYSLKAQYRARNSTRWVLHRDLVKACAKLKDSNNNFIWSSGMGPGGAFQNQPETLLGMPYSESEWAPNTLTSGLYVAVLGDFSKYWIADALSLEIQQLVELYAATNQVGYLARKETDGMPVLEEAFARLKLA